MRVRGEALHDPIQSERLMFFRIGGRVECLRLGRTSFEVLH